jgi:hypothetical protein
VGRYLAYFKREGWGIWTCVEDVRLELAEGEIEVMAGASFVAGTKHMGVDLAMLLEAERARTGRP